VAASGAGWWAAVGSLALSTGTLVAVGPASAGAVAPNAVTQSITTIAGNGSCGYTGDGAVAVDAQLSSVHDENHPSYIAEDLAGSLYIADTNNDVVRKVVSPTAVNRDVITTYAGHVGRSGGPTLGNGGPATSARLNQPTGLAIDSHGDLFIADTNNNEVREVLAYGTIVDYAGNGVAGMRGDGGPATSAQLDHPTGLALDSAGDLFIADTNNNEVREVRASDHTIVDYAGHAGHAGMGGDGGPATSAGLNHPTGVAVDSSNNLYISDTGNHYVRVVNATGTVTAFAGQSGMDAGVGGANNGNGGPATSALLSQPSGLAVDASGDVFIADVNTDVVRMVNTAGNINTYAGNGFAGYSGDGGAALAAMLQQPTGVVADAEAVYITDSGNCVVRGVFNGPPPVLKG
jgi:hypothetical protein